MMKHIIAILAIFLAVFSVGAQNITNIEYSIDEFVHSGEGTIVPLSGTETEIDFNFSLDISALASGIHILYTRTQNSDGVWSLPTQQTFYVPEKNLSENITEIEYSIDEFVKAGDGSSILVDDAANALDSIIKINIEELTPGIHSINVRTKNDFGRWSLPTKSNFYINKVDTAKIKSIHYRVFQSDDEGEWLSKPVNPERKMVDSTFGFSLEGLTVNEEYSVEIYAENNLGVRGYSVVTNSFTLRENHAPMAISDSLDLTVYTNESVSVDFDTLFSDDDLVYGDSLTYNYIDYSGGELYAFSDSSSDDNITISPQAINTGTYSFKVYAKDIAGDIDSSVISLSVIKINHAPVAIKNELNLLIEETGQLQLAMDTLFEDEDITDGDILTYSFLDTSSTSIEDFSSWTTNSLFSIAPQEGNDGVYTFWLIATDTEGAQDSIPVSLTVENINHSPVTLKESISSTIIENEYWQLSMDTLFNDEDVADGDVLTYLLSNTSSMGGDFSSWISDDVLQFYPQSGDNGTYSYWLKATDSENESDSIEVNITVTEVVGVNNTYKEKYRIYPNPSNGIFNIQMEASELNKSLIYIYSLEGKLLKSFKYEQQEVKISELPKGMYILKVITTSNSFEERIVIDK